VSTDDVRRGAQLLAELLLRDVERIAEHSATRMQGLLPSYARVPLHELTPITARNTRNLLEAIRNPDADPDRAQAAYRASGERRARQGITSDEMLNAWRIGLEGVREAAHEVADELGLGTDVLLEFVVATLEWGDVGMRASASAHHEAEIRELGRLVKEQAALRRVATLVARGAPAGSLLAVVAEQVADVLGVALAGIVRYDADGIATQVATYPAGREGFRAETRLPLDGTSVPAAVRERGRPARIDDYTDLRGVIAETARAAGIGSSVGVPIVVAGRLWGAIVVSSQDRDPLPPGTESHLLGFSDLVGMAISNANARAEVDRLAEDQAALRRVATLVAQGVSSEELSDAVSEEVGRLFGADVVGLARYEAGDALTVLGPWTPAGRRPDVAGRLSLEGATLARTIRDTARPAREDSWDQLAGSVAEMVRDRLGIRSAVGSPILVGGRVWGALFAATTQRAHMAADTEPRLEAFAELVATSVANAQARAEVERLAQEQAALRRVATMVARESPAEEIFATVAEEVGLLLGGETTVIQRYEPDGDAIVAGGWGTVREAFPVGRRLTLDGDSVTDLVYRTARPVRVESYEHAAGSIAADARQWGLRSAVGSPIVVNGRLWGSIVVGSSLAEPMPVDAESRIAQFTELIATAISNVQARSDLAASRARVVAASDETRRQIERDLHDGAQQRLIHIALNLKLATEAIEKEPEALRGLLAEALEHAEQATVDLRELVHGILPPILTHGGLRPAVRALARRMPLPVQTDLDVGRFPPAIEATAYFVVAEALTNVAKHSGAGVATVVVRVDAGVLEIQVRDDGVGGARADGSGLIGLADRVAAVDGRLRIESPANGGTVIAASLPCGRRCADAP
jgi:signal transduction histidine kinase/uncharacterized protein YoaH (UPF0181 family)